MKDMLGRSSLITAEEALMLVLDGLPDRARQAEVLGIDDCLGRIAAAEVISEEDLPPFPRSTVDGYAVKASDTFSASDTMPAYLMLSGEVQMGCPALISVTEGQAIKIPTGGMLPPGADAVVMFEYVQSVDSKMLEITKAVAPGENVVQPAEDVARGDRLIHAGQRMRPQDIGACAGIGVTAIPVYKKPLVAVISTGDEIVPSDRTPAAGKIRDINSYLLKGLITESGAAAKAKGICRDIKEDIRSVIEESVSEAEMVLISGGTSVGTKDLIAKIIDDMGDPGVLFHGIALKPGKPLIGAIIHGIPVFGLPGHPAAVSICFELLIRPVLNRISGLAEKQGYTRAATVTARLAKNISSVQGREEHVRVILEERNDGLWAVPVISKSGLVTTMVRTDGTIRIPLNVNGLPQGETVEVRLFR